MKRYNTFKIAALLASHLLLALSVVNFAYATDEFEKPKETFASGEFGVRS